MEDRTSNLLGAFGVLLGDEVRAAASSEVGGGAAASALVFIGSTCDPNIDAMARALALSHSGAVRLVDRLQRDGYVERAHGTDARSVALRLTSRGRTTLARLRAARREVLDRRLAPLSAAERRQLVGLLEKLLAEAVAGGVYEWRVCQLCEVAVCMEPYCPVDRAARAQEAT